MRQVHNFLGVQEIEFKKVTRHKSFPYPKMAPDLRRKLLEYFEPYNQKLYDYLDRDFCWS